ncbi:dual specificity protein kinase pyk3 [Anaeramoeba flamelloides]|uniref:Dual specificity protein kinase pyk3 n=1 Tax=Anaeramoeba flamelloides TaxID=1746091 RepID=A0AAV7YLJ1_9EUKA|nr:dual specificity protein kinase pyk3 [Anaeramoeba flamelloides]
MKTQKFLVFSDCDHTTNSLVSKLGISVIDFLESHFNGPDLQVFFDSPDELAKDLQSILDKISITTYLDLIWVTNKSSEKPTMCQMGIYGIFRRLSQWPFVHINIITKSKTRSTFIQDWVEIFNIQVINNASDIDTKKFIWRGELISYSKRKNSLIDLYSEKDSSLKRENKKEKEQDNEEEEKENISAFTTIRQLLLKENRQFEGSENHQNELLTLSGFEIIYSNTYSTFPKTFFTNERYYFHLQMNNFLNVDMIYVVKPIISQFKRLVALDSWEKKINKREVIKIQKFLKKIDCLLFSVFYDKMEKKWVYQKIILSPKWLFTINSAIYQLIDSSLNPKSLLLSKDNLFDYDLINLLKFQKSKEFEELIEKENLNMRKRNHQNQNEDDKEQEGEGEVEAINIIPELEILKKRKLIKIKKDKENQNLLLQIINSFDSEGFPKYQSFANKNENLKILKYNSENNLVNFNSQTKMKSWMFQKSHNTNNTSTIANSSNNKQHGIEYQTENSNLNCIGNGTDVLNKDSWEFESLINIQTLQKESPEKVKERILKEREIDRKKRIQKQKSQQKKKQESKNVDNNKKKIRNNQSNQNRMQIKKCVEEIISKRITKDHPNYNQIHVSLFKISWCLLEKKIDYFTDKIIDPKIIRNLVNRWAEYVLYEFNDKN